MFALDRPPTVSPVLHSGRQAVKRLANRRLDNPVGFDSPSEDIVRDKQSYFAFMSWSFFC